MPAQENHQLSTTRAALAEAEAGVLRLGERVHRIEQELKRSATAFDPQDVKKAERRKKLTAELDQARADHDGAKKERRAAQDKLTGLHGTLAPVTDPRKLIEELPADLPILLFPVRLETRFSKALDQGVERACLLVRVYPDDALVDTFEEGLSTTEVINAKTFWCGWWKSRGDTMMRQAYWRDLVAGNGKARARYAALHYKPLNASDPEPAPASNEVTLVIPSFTAIGIEKDAVNAYWTSVWRAVGNATLLTEAFNTLKADTDEARAEELIASFAPFNPDEVVPPGTDRATVVVRVVHLVFSDPATLDLRITAWAMQPKARLLPDRFVLVLESPGGPPVEVVGAPVIGPLAVGPDPRAAKEDQYQPDANGDLNIPEEQRWLSDFSKAMEVGMAFRAFLTPQQATAGFKRVYVVGLRMADGPEWDSDALQTLIQRHQESSAGFGLLPQGTPTNRTESDSEEAVWQGDDGFDEFILEVSNTPAFNVALTDERDRSDGAMLADSLGIDPSVFQTVPHAAGTDMAEAHCMNAALWPATLGYWMDTMMDTVFGDDEIGRTREFFEKHVIGRGSLPSVRIGKQPYGILPTTAFSRLSFAKGQQSTAGSFESVLHAKMKLLRERFWDERARDAAHVGKATTDPQQLLLDIIGLHPSSVEYHRQWAESMDAFWNRLHLTPFFDARWWAEAIRVLAAPAILRELGHNGADPDLLKKIFGDAPIALTGDVIDDRPLSETEPVREWTTDQKNYLQWLADKAGTSFDALRREEGFIDGKAPGALLYLLLHHALELGFHSSAVGMHNGVLDKAGMRRLRQEKPFIHVEGNGASESRYAVLYNADPAITGSADLLIADHIINVLGTAPATLDLQRQIDAVRRLASLPTARLERLFAEHIDLCTHRLDAWMLGLVHHRLQGMRAQRPTGIAIGAYGYVEDLKPKPASQVMPLNEAQTVTFGTAQAIVDPTNGGFIHAPSADQATTAAILRNAHIRNATPTNPDLFAIDLSSERVRIAMGLIEGLRNGQSLGALLGYRFERGLHDRGGSVELDEFIFEIRMAFPLLANRMSDTVDVEGSIETIEARNVVDGRKLVEHVIAHHNTPFPWGKDIPRGTSTQEAAINEEVRKLKEAHDALADLALAESIHQVARGNTERAAAAMDMFSKGTFPVQPEVVKTPRSGTVLTHRMALHLDTGAAPGISPRAIAEPAVNAWLKTVLPPFTDIVVRVGLVEDDRSITAIETVSWLDLGLDAIDLLHLLDLHNERGMGAIDDRVIQFVRNKYDTTVDITPTVTPDRELRLLYTTQVANHVTLFEVASLVESLRALLFGVRHWKPEDASLPNEASKVMVQGSVDPLRIQAPRAVLSALHTEVIATKDAIDARIIEPIDFLPLLGEVDVQLAQFMDLQERAGRMGVAMAGWGGVTETKRAFFAEIRKRVTANVIDAAGNKNHVTRWDEKLALCDAKVAQADTSTLSDYSRIEVLKEAEAAISTVFTRTTLPNPLTLAGFRDHIVNTLRPAFVAVHNELIALSTNTERTFAGLYGMWENAVVDMASHDPTPIDLNADRGTIITLVNDLSRALQGLQDDLQQRLNQSQEKLTASNTATGEEQCRLRIESMRALFGDDVIVLPRYSITSDQLAEWDNAWNDRSNKVAHLSGMGMDRHMDEWLYGVARVRTKAGAWENMLVMTEAFNTITPALEPVQFPHRSGEPWLALQWPEGFNVHEAGEHVLYTSAYAGGTFNSAALQCGLMLDEWTEVIPSKDESTNVTFHYDQPSNEAPQSWLLAVPASTGTHWNWEDLKQTIPDTIELARMRAIEPRAFDNSPIARFLPATIAAVTTRRTTIGVDLARNVTAELLLKTILPNG